MRAPRQQVDRRGRSFDGIRAPQTHAHQQGNRVAAEAAQAPLLPPPPDPRRLPPGSVQQEQGVHVAHLIPRDQLQQSSCPPAPHRDA